MSRNNAFDVPMDAVCEQYPTMDELMRRHLRHKREKDWEKARETLEYAAQSLYLPAQIELANLYKSTPELNIPHQERYNRAEAIYKRLLATLDLPASVTAAIALELADLYGNYMRRPLGGLAMLLRARRLGAHVPERTLETCRRQTAQTDVNEYGSNGADAFALATELQLLGESDRFVELLLRECTDGLSGTRRGIAALALADFYNERGQRCPAHRKEAVHYYRLARQDGFGEYLNFH